MIINNERQGVNMGLFGFLGLGMIVKSAIECASEDYQCKQQVTKLPNGLEYWRDRKGRMRSCQTGELIFYSNGVCKDIHGNILFDEKVLENKRVKEKALANKKPYQPYCYAVQHNSRTTNPATTDLVTGKVVARVEDYSKLDGTHEYRKWYLKDSFAESHPGEDLSFVIKESPCSYSILDDGILISKEEFDAINNCPGLNQYNFRYHRNDYRMEQKFNWKTGKFECIDTDKWKLK